LETKASLVKCRLTAYSA